MSGSLQHKVHGGSHKPSSVMKTLGSYNKTNMRKLGHYNGVVKRMGVYNGVSTGKSNLWHEVYPRH